jgi:hypothetical protein
MESLAARSVCQKECINLPHGNILLTTQLSGRRMKGVTEMWRLFAMLGARAATATDGYVRRASVCQQNA